MFMFMCIYATKAVAFYKQVRQDHACIITAAAIAGTSYAIMDRSRNRGMICILAVAAPIIISVVATPTYALNQVDTFPGPTENP